MTYRTAAVALIASGCIGCAAMPFDLQGHRGARGHHPENTLAGFDAALATGVTTLELDAGVTRDGVVVAHHDERITPDIARRDGSWLDEPGPAIRELSYPELMRYDVGRLRPGSAYAGRFATQRPHDGAHVPRLTDVIAMAEASSGGRIRYNIETKLSPHAPADTLPPEPFAQKVVALLRSTGVADRATIQSFDWRTLEVVQQIAPAIETACLTSEQPDFDTVQANEPGASPWTAGLDVDAFRGVPELVRAAGCDAWSPYYGDIHSARLMRAHALGLRVVVWTVNEPADIAAMIDLGVDGIISDYPDRVRQAMQRRGMALPSRFPRVE